MTKKRWHCPICGTLTDNRVCWPCHARLSLPCTECGKPTPTITRTGKQAKNRTCIACTTHLKAHTRRIGITCAVCSQRYAMQKETDYYYQVCPSCKTITSSCPVCDTPMPKYVKRGRLREACSNRCRKLLHPITPEQRRKGAETQRANHGVYKSHLNDIARGRIEYPEWRRAVFERDDYTCQHCHATSGNGQAIELHPHHTKHFATHPDLRYELSNGITLCAQCHRKKHQHVFISRTRKQDSRQLGLAISAKRQPHS